ncbi:hypothetical protein SAMN04488113_12921 [Alkalibacterium gilvum]|uniref:Uncharacterized protein n=1 Tax=Alkalibacterium gilvum TaxID=1130080 RepID=A0A1H6ULB7_9LACT|nr:hypothetical protein [Alkalibacterium gilvum]SEI88885.1 hypothetical protein SAMN04488113_12921 [Alkalibacterium gilvum]
MDIEKVKSFYEDYISKIGKRKALYKKVINDFDVSSVLYPGSHIDISPSFIIPNVTYIDNFKGAIRFFKDIDAVNMYIDEQKDYKEKSEAKFIGKNYYDNLDIEPVDLVISQYAGFVGQATKDYLKKDGILLCNDSHGDATLAYCDEDYIFIGIVDSHNQVSCRNLDHYFKLPKEKAIDSDRVKDKMKGLRYTKTANNYLFKKR